MLRSFSRKFQPKTDLGLRFEVVQSFRLVWTKQNVACHLPFSAFKSCAFYIRAFFFIRFKPYISPVRLHGLHATVRW